MRQRARKDGRSEEEEEDEEVSQGSSIQRGSDGRKRRGRGEEVESQEEIADTQIAIKKRTGVGGGCRANPLMAATSVLKSL